MFIHLKNILFHYIKQSGISRQIEAVQAVEEFNKIIAEMFGRNILKKARAAYLRNKILTVRCLSSVLIQEIHLKEKRIINELNKRLKKEVVSRIKFKM